MKLDMIEKTVRWAGAVGALAFGATMFTGLRRGWRQPVGTTSGSAPAILRNSPTFYVPASAVGVGLMYALWRPLPAKLSKPARAVALLVGAPLLFAGLALMLWGRFTLGKSYNVSSSLGAQLYADQRLVTTGPYAIVRNPMYVGGVLAEIGAFLIYRTWAAAFVLINIPVLFTRARREEEALAAQFDEQWAAYKRNVPAWLPRSLGGHS